MDFYEEIESQANSNPSNKFKPNKYDDTRNKINPAKDDKSLYSASHMEYEFWDAA